MELCGECWILPVRGEALLSVRGDLGGTLGGKAIKSLEPVWSSFSWFGAAEGMIKGGNSLAIREDDRFVDLSSECPSCDVAWLLSSVCGFGNSAARGVG